MPFTRITILGVGLLGGSIGLAAKSALTSCHITGYGHRKETLERAVEIGAIDFPQPDLAKAVSSADLVILCTPVGLFQPILSQIASQLLPCAVVTDVGSTKRRVVQDAQRLLPASVRFVGSHPMAGSEKRGVEFARADLFQQAMCILTPTQLTNATALANVEQFWKALGMRVSHLSPDRHDELVAQMSHLPHALAAALVAIQQTDGLALCGKGFLDTTRIAGGDCELWRDIFLDNADNLRLAIDRLRGELSGLEAMLQPGRSAELARWLEQARQRRDELVQRRLREVGE